MLRRMDGWVASGFGRMDWDGAGLLGRRALVWLALAGTAYLLCRAQLPPLLAPFGMAFLAAGLAAGKNGAALLAGCLAGAVEGSLAAFNLRLPAGAAIALGGGIAWDALSPALRRALGQGPWLRLAGQARGTDPMPRRQARSPTRPDATAGPVLAGLGVLIPGLAGMGEAIWPSAAMVAAASVVAATATPFFSAALQAHPRRRWLSVEEKAGVFLLGAFMLLGLARLSLPVALCVGCALTQLLSGCGALAGAGVGGALLIAGADPRIMALTAVGGATVQLCCGRSRPVRAVCASGGMLCTGLLLNAPPQWLFCVGASSLLVAPMPEAWACFFPAWRNQRRTPVIPSSWRRAFSGLPRSASGCWARLLASWRRAMLRRPSCRTHMRWCSGCGSGSARAAPAMPDAGKVGQTAGRGCCAT